VLPLIAGLLLGTHYFRASRSHRHSLTVPMEVRGATGRRIPFLPDMLTREVLLTIAGILVLVVIAYFFYDAPLEHHADPRHTPLDTQAPWFFLWLQGLLKLGDKVLMGVVIPLLSGIGLLLVPYLDPTPHRPLKKRPLALAVTAVALVALLTLSYMGTHRYGLDLPPAERIAQRLAPQEGVGPLRRVPFDQLKVGLYDIDTVDPASLPPALGRVLAVFSDAVHAAAQKTRYLNAAGIMVVEDWQKDLKRVTLRMSWEDPAFPTRKNFERIVHLHRER
jgi:hypothetical protein